MLHCSCYVCGAPEQEKEILERQNAWLNDELTAKVNSFFELRKKHTELDADMSSKLADVSKFNVAVEIFFPPKVNFVFLTFLCFNIDLIYCQHFQVERQFSECSKSLQWNKDRVRELETKLKSMQEVENVPFIMLECDVWIALCQTFPD